MEKIIEMLAKAEADRKNDKEEAETNRKAYQARLEAKLDKILGIREEDKPASVGSIPGVAEQDVPVKDATVMPVGEPRKRRRDRKLAAERRRQKTKDTTRKNCGLLKKFAAYCRKTSRRATVARRWRRDFKKEIPQGTFGCQQKVAAPSRMSLRARVARRRGHIIGITRTKNVARRTPRGQRSQEEPEGSIGPGKRYRRQQPRLEKKESNVTYGKTTGPEVKKRIAEFSVGLRQHKDWKLWRGRPPPKRKKGNSPLGGTGNRSTDLPRKCECATDESDE